MDRSYEIVCIGKISNGTVEKTITCRLFDEIQKIYFYIAVIILLFISYWFSPYYNDGFINLRRVQ